MKYIYINFIFASFVILFSINLLAADQVTEIPADIDLCSKDSECIMVAHKHCCGTTKKAINSKNLKAYNEHPSWQKTAGEICAVIGQCLSNELVSISHCSKIGSEKRCVEGPRSKKASTP